MAREGKIFARIRNGSIHPSIHPGAGGRSPRLITLSAVVALALVGLANGALGHPEDNVSGEPWIAYLVDDGEWSCTKLYGPQTENWQDAACVRGEGKFLVTTNAPHAECVTEGTDEEPSYCYHMENEAFSKSDHTWVHAWTNNHGQDHKECRRYEGCRTFASYFHQDGTIPNPPCHFYTVNAQGFLDANYLIAAGGVAAQDGEACP